MRPLTRWLAAVCALAGGLAAARGQGPDDRPRGPDFARLPAKLPLTDAQRLSVVEGGEEIAVSGETFAYHFSKQNGLIDRIEVLGDALTDGPIPDLTLAEN